MYRLLTLVLLLFITGCVENKKSPYRTERINFIYEKALQHVTDRQNLARLEAKSPSFFFEKKKFFQKELSGYDAIYLASKSNRQGAQGTKELDKIDDKLATILEKYGLEKAVMAFKEKYKHKNLMQQTDDNEPLPSDKFTDQNLQKLWSQAQTGKFSQKDLHSLHGELKEVERKMRIYEDQLEDFKKVPHENSIHHDIENIGEKTKKLKAANREYNDHLDEVHRRVTSEEYSPFSEPRVKRLWKLAQENEKLSQHELNVLKDELSHFESQLKKIEFHKEEVSRLQEDAEERGKSKTQVYENLELSIKHEKLNRKARKLEKYLEEKIIIHREL
ncbi:Protein CBG08577 [Caenorhabditis briggsae]|uniref:Protein CBG08577 n=1 Tax=Caenorhabditis briggsae TaxID=6238 RepID=A8X731_CAEBR|nr:Protein CBG08577 [Caenorhabditis briggsae]CAP28442.2 Protein CBG08577 [Caenorhabditis briggsae]